MPITEFPIVTKTVLELAETDDKTIDTALDATDYVLGHDQSASESVAFTGAAITATANAAFAASTDKAKLDGIEVLATADQSAAEVPYDNAASGLTATDVQSAIDELDAASVTDHGALTGLGDDDHTQYLLVDGTRAMTGNITMTGVGTVDGRDVSADGSKLDGIEIGATADQSAAEVVFTPDGDIAAATVQAAIVEVRDDTEIKLDDKLDLAGGTMTGNITMTGAGTVDGRDLSVDGTKLDGIESGATADQSAAEVSYDNTASGLTAGNVKSAIDELARIKTVTESGTSYTTSSALTNGRNVTTTNGATVTVTAASGVAGDSCVFSKAGAGDVEFAADGGVTIRSAADTGSGVKIEALYGQCTLTWRTATEVWVSGDLVSQ